MSMAHSPAKPGNKVNRTKQDVDTVFAPNTCSAPGYVVPACTKLQRKRIVAQAITKARAGLNMRYPSALPEVQDTLIK